LRYFGSVDGSLRYFPGDAWQLLSSEFDHRTRPWYVAPAATFSIPLSVVIVLDTSFSRHAITRFADNNSLSKRTGTNETYLIASEFKAEMRRTNDSLAVTNVFFGFSSWM
jgi:hypothetical protein